MASLVLASTGWPPPESSIVDEEDTFLMELPGVFVDEDRT
jgi:hypothetical protein